MSAAASASTALAAAVLAAAAQLGLSGEELLDASGIAAEQLADVEGRLPLQSLIDLERAIQTRLGAGAAIQVAQHMLGRQGSLLAHLCANAGTLREFFESVCRYLAIDMEIDPPTLDIRNGLANFGYVHTHSLTVRMGMSLERDLAMWYARARAATQGKWAPSAVHLQTPTSNLSAYRDFFGAPVYHDAPAFRLVFPADLLDLQLSAGGDAVLRAYLRPMADALLMKLRAHGNFSQVVRTALLRNIQQGACTIGGVARALAISARTLQRRLENEGTTFGEVYDLARRDAVIEQLRNPRVAIKEAAFRAGFSEASTFYRAFRRWTGITPAHYRQSLNMLVA